MEVDAYHLQSAFQDVQPAFQEQHRQKRDEMKQFYNQGMEADAARQDKKRYDRELDIMIAHKKDREDHDMQARKVENDRSHRSKHFPENISPAMQQLAEINYQKEVEKADLEELIAVKGGHDLNQRIATFRVAESQQNSVDRQNHLKKLKEQT